MDPGKVSAGIGSSAPGSDCYWMAPRCVALLLACDQHRVLVQIWVWSVSAPGIDGCQRCGRAVRQILTYA